MDPSSLAGPPELGRSVLVRPGEPVPAAWVGCERLRVSTGDFSAEIGRRLRDAWLTRTRLVIELDGEMPDPAAVWHAPWWELQPGLTLRSEVLLHLLTANAVDARDPAGARFAPVEAALRLGATRADSPDEDAGDAGDSASAVGRGSGTSDVITDAGPVWCDGGPLDTFDLPLAVIPAANLAARSLQAVRAKTPDADLATDQHDAVGHLGGAACIVAPAGSGKTRVLTERARYLVRDVGIAAGAVCLVAFNVRARREMEERTHDLTGLQVRTLNSLALAICNGTGPFARPAHHSRVAVIGEIDVRERLDGYVKRRRRAMTDQLAPWLEALSATRLGLRDLAEVERDFQPDVPDFADVAPRYVADLEADGLVDFDQQIIQAIDILLRDPAARAAARRICGVLLIDEFQDLTPAHLLLIRLLAGPRADVFGVGDDDQTIYGYAGASPQWLIDFDRYFPGAKRHHLHVNYRCPPPVVGAAVNLLSHNHLRIDKQITAAGDRKDADAAAANASVGAVTVADSSDAATALRQTVSRLIEGGVRPSNIAVLTRVNSTLLVPQVVLGDMGVAADAPLGRRFLERTGVAAALAWLKLATAPRHALPSGALSDAARRPPRGISPRVIEWIGEQRTLGELRALADRLSDERTSIKINEFADDLDFLRQRTANEQLTTRQILEAVRDELGLGSSLDSRLDASRRSVDRSAHGDDLRALISVAHLHPDPSGFAGWLAAQLDGGGHGRGRDSGDAMGFGTDEGARAAHQTGGGEASRNAAGRAGSGSGWGGGGDRGGDSGSDRVRLATVHRVKGLEWPHVIVYEASAGLMPHRLSHDVEEERRVFHVALTRCSESVTLICGDEPSPFLPELRKMAPPRPDPAPGEPAGLSASSPSRQSPSGDAAGLFSGSGGAAVGSSTRTGSRQSKPEPPTDPSDAAIFEALRAWRRERSKTDGVPAYVVFPDAVLIRLATQHPRNEAELLAVSGIGPAKLAAYGAEALALIAEHT